MSKKLSESEKCYRLEKKAIRRLYEINCVKRNLENEVIEDIDLQE